MLNIGLQHFRMVHTIVREGSLTKAAAVLYLTQSALSHQLRELEKELNTPVFYRKGKRMVLSNEGKRVLCSAEKILAELQALEEDMTGYREGRTGKLNISTQCYTAYHWLPGVLKPFKEASPDISIHIMSEATFRPLEFLLSGELDIGIVKTKTDNPDIHYEPIFEDQLYVVMHRDHPLSYRKKVEVNDFQDEELFLAFSDPTSGNLTLIETLMQLHDVKPKKTHRIHYTEAIIEMLHANMGISVMANWIISPYLKTKDIVARPLAPDVSRRTWYAATCKDNVPIRNFLSCLKTHFPQIISKADREVLDEETVMG